MATRQLRAVQTLRLSLIALLLLAAPAWAVTGSSCPPTFNCSWTHELLWSPAVPGSVTISWSQSLGGPIDHTQIADAAAGRTTFEITNGTWYVTISIVSADGSVLPQTLTTVCRNADDCVPIGPVPAAPSGLKVI